MVMSLWQLQIHKQMHHYILLFCSRQIYIMFMYNQQCMHLAVHLFYLSKMCKSLWQSRLNVYVYMEQSRPSCFEAQAQWCNNNTEYYYQVPLRKTTVTFMQYNCMNNMNSMLKCINHNCGAIPMGIISISMYM